MRNGMKIYEEKSLYHNAGKDEKKGILIVSHENFKILIFSLLPSIDETDRENSIFEKLEERFIDITRLAFIYFDVMQVTEMEETVFCCYLEGTLKMEPPSYIEYAIPGFLLAKYIKKEDKFCIVDFGKEEIFLFLYQKSKLVKYKKILRLNSIEEENAIFLLNIFPRIQEGTKILLIGEYSDEEYALWNQNFCIVPLEEIKIKRITEKEDVFHHRRISKKYLLFSNRIFEKLLGIFLILVIILGFFFQYKVEKLKEKLSEEETIVKKHNMECELLQENIVAIVQQIEEMKENEKKTINYDSKISKDLMELYFLSNQVVIETIECSEERVFKIKFRTISSREYLEFLYKILNAKFKFLNHEEISHKEGNYEIMVEIQKDKS